MDDTIKFWFFCLVRVVFCLCDKVLDLICGVSLMRGSKHDRQEAGSYEKSAQIVDIVWRAKMALYTVTRINCFVYKHGRYVHPEYVLRHANVTLLAVEKDYALFAVTDPAVDIYDTSKFPFLFLSQFLEAKQLVIMPIRSFHRLADEIGDPKVPVAMLAMTTRCGSTLVTQMFNRVPGVRAVSEIWATGNIHELRCTGSITPGESRRLLKSSIRLQCKIEPNSKVATIFMKLTAFHAPQIRDFSALFPKFVYIFNTRHPVPSLKSLKKVIGPVKRDLYTLLSVRWREEANMDFAISYKRRNPMIEGYSRWFQNIDHDVWGIIMYSTTVLSFFENKTLFDAVVLYEKLMENPQSELQRMFDLLDIHHENIPEALKALKTDSQNGTWGVRGGGDSILLDQAFLSTFDNYMQRLDLPIRHDMTDIDFRSIFER